MVDRETEVDFNTMITPETFLMGLRSPEIAEESSPGQFVMIRAGKGMDPLLRRPFSVAGIREDGLVLILYRVIGRGTKILAEVRKGERLPVMGPLGRGFQRPGEITRPILVAGGIGVAPLFFLAQALNRRDMEFMAGYGSSKEIIDTKQIFPAPPDITYSTDDGTLGHPGMVTDLLDKYLSQNRGEEKSFSIFACGPLPMLKRVAATAADRDIPLQVSLEAAMACGLGACQGCAVNVLSLEGGIHYYRVCSEGPVFPGNALDWSRL